MTTRPTRTLSLLLFVFATVAVVGAVFVATVGPVALLARHTGPAEAFVFEHTGRRLTFGTITGHVYPELVIEVQGIELSSDQPDAPAMLVLPSLLLRFDLWRAVRSLGDELVLETVTINGGVLRATIKENGAVDLLELLAMLPPMKAEDIDGGVLESLRVQGARIEVLNKDGVVVSFRDISIKTDNASPGMPADIRIGGVWEGSDAVLDLDVHMDQVPPDMNFLPPPTVKARLQVAGADLPLTLEGLGLPPVFHSGIADVDLTVKTGKDSLKLDLDVDAHDVTAFDAGSVVGDDGVGESVVPAEDARLKFKMATDTATGRTTVETLAFEGVGVTVDGTWIAAHGLVDDIETLKLDVSIREMQRVRSRIPVLRDIGAGALDIRGPAAGSLVLGKDSIDVDVDLARSVVGFGEAVRKQAGQPATLKFHGDRDARLTTARAPGRIDGTLIAALPGDVVIEGDVVLQPQGVDLAYFDLHTRPARIKSVLAVSPLLNEVLAEVVDNGKLQVTTLAFIGLERSDIDLQLRGRDVALALDDKKSGVSGRGGGDATIDIAIGSDAAGLDFKVKADLGGVRARFLDTKKGTVLFAKDKEVPFLFDASLAEVGGAGTLATGLGRLGEVSQQSQQNVKIVGVDPAQEAAQDVVDDIVVGDGLSPRWHTFATGLAGSARVVAGPFTTVDVAIKELDINLALTGGHFIVKAPSSLQVFGGMVSVAGTVVDFAQVPARALIHAEVHRFDLARVLAKEAEKTGPLSGAVSIFADLECTGLTLETLASSVKGPVAISTHALRIESLEKVSETASGFVGFIQKLWGSDEEKADIAGAVADATWVLNIRDRGIHLDKPFVVDTGVGPLSLTGSTGFDQQLDVLVHLELGAQDTFRQSKGSAGVSKGVPLEMRVTGTWEKPKADIAGFDTALTQLKEQAQELIDGVDLEVQRASASVDATLNPRDTRPSWSVSKAKAGGPPVPGPGPTTSPTNVAVVPASGTVTEIARAAEAADAGAADAAEAADAANADAGAANDISHAGGGPATPATDDGVAQNDDDGDSDAGVSDDIIAAARAAQAAADALAATGPAAAP